jgi:flavoprotein
MSIPITDDVARRAVNELLQGRTHAASSFALAVAPATTTTVVKIGISANSVILTTAYIALASQADILSIVPAKDRFVVTHTASADARTHHYVWFTGLAT